MHFARCQKLQSHMYKRAHTYAYVRAYLRKRVLSAYILKHLRTHVYQQRSALTINTQRQRQCHAASALCNSNALAQHIARYFTHLQFTFFAVCRLLAVLVFS